MILKRYWKDAIRYKLNHLIYSPVFQTRNCRIILHHRQLIKLLTGWDETFVCVGCHGAAFVGGCFVRSVGKFAAQAMHCQK